MKLRIRLQALLIVHRVLHNGINIVQLLLFRFSRLLGSQPDDRTFHSDARLCQLLHIIIAVLAGQLHLPCVEIVRALCHKHALGHTDINEPQNIQRTGRLTQGVAPHCKHFAEVFFRRQSFSCGKRS